MNLDMIKALEDNNYKLWTIKDNKFSKALRAENEGEFKL